MLGGINGKASGTRRRSIAETVKSRLTMESAAFVSSRIEAQTHEDCTRKDLTHTVEIPCSFGTSVDRSDRDDGRPGESGRLFLKQDDRRNGPGRLLRLISAGRRRRFPARRRQARV